jgi:hypothetical protein
VFKRLSIFYQREKQAQLQEFRGGHKDPPLSTHITNPDRLNMKLDVYTHMCCFYIVVAEQITCACVHNLYKNRQAEQEFMLFFTCKTWLPFTYNLLLYSSCRSSFCELVLNLHILDSGWGLKEITVGENSGDSRIF